jgi:Lrp/AsnC family transcriptional regulator, leucine-responsive regulatory protein
MKRSGDLDATDVAILEALQENARKPFTKLGRELGLSQPAISERVSRLEESGVIMGYGVRLNHQKLGLGLLAIIRLRTTHENIKTCLERFRQMPNIVEVHRVTGEDCFVLKVLIPTPGQLEAIVDRIAVFGAVTTSLVLRSEPPTEIGRALLGKNESV